MRSILFSDGYARATWTGRIDSTTMTTEFIEQFDATITRLGVVMAPDGSPGEIEGVLNPACVRDRKGLLLLYPRAVGAGNVSRIGLACDRGHGDVVDFKRLGYALEPQAEY